MKNAQPDMIRTSLVAAAAYSTGGTHGLTALNRTSTGHWPLER
jgi:hypothetical protein